MGIEEWAYLLTWKLFSPPSVQPPMNWKNLSPVITNVAQQQHTLYAVRFLTHVSIKKLYGLCCWEFFELNMFLELLYLVWRSKGWGSALRAEPMRAPGFCSPRSAQICQWRAPLCIPAAFLHLSLLMCLPFGLSPLLSSTILPTSSSHLCSSKWHCNCSVPHSIYICLSSFI